MPKKSHKVAARQARLSQRKRRQARGPTLVPGPSVPEERKEGPVGVERNPRATTAPTPARPQAAPRHTVYHYIVPEVRRIAILMGLVLAVLIVLTFVLK